MVDANNTPIGTRSVLIERLMERMVKQDTIKPISRNWLMEKLPTDSFPLYSPDSYLCSSSKIEEE